MSQKINKCNYWWRKINRKIEENSYWWNRMIVQDLFISKCRMKMPPNAIYVPRKSKKHKNKKNRRKHI